jgi:hypothetical protein
MPPPVQVMILLPLKERTPASGERTDGFFFVERAEGFGSVFDDVDSVVAARFENGIEVGALAEEMNDDESFGKLVDAGAFLEEFGEEVWIEIPGDVIAVDENGFGAFVEDGVATAGEGEGGAGDFIAGFDAENAKGEMDGGGAAGESDCVTAETMADEGFGFVDVFADAGEPVRVEGLHHVRNFAAGHVGNGEVDQLGRAGGWDEAHRFNDK